MIILTVVILFLIYYICIYNKAVYYKKKVEQAISGIDVYLKQRFDLVPNLVECVKEYSKYEEDTLETIVNLRESYDMSDHLNITNEINHNDRLNSYIAKIEAYPNLKANEQYIKLEKQLIKLENQIQAARRILNIDVTSYNIYIKTFPKNILLFKFNEEDLFSTKNEEKENIKI